MTQAGSNISEESEVNLQSEVPIPQSKTLRALIIEDHEDDALLLVRQLEQGAFDVIFRRVETPEAMREALDTETWDIIISGYGMPRFNGLAALEVARESVLELPFIIVSDVAGEEVTVEAMRSGAHDYLMKGNLERLTPAVERALKETRMRRERPQAEEALRRSEGWFSQIIQGSPVPTFVIDRNHVVTHWNSACESLTGIAEKSVVGAKKQWSAFFTAPRPVMADLLVDNASEIEIMNYYGDTCRPSPLIDGTYEAEKHFPDLGEKGKWLFITAAPLRDLQGTVIGAIETLQNISERKENERRIGLLLEHEEAINRLAFSLSDLRGFQKIYRRVYEYLSGTIEVDSFIISSYDPTSQLILAECLIHNGDEHDIRHLAPIPLEDPGRGTQSQVIRTGLPLYIRDWPQAMERTTTQYHIDADGATIEGPPPEGSSEASTKSAILAPMQIEGDTVGVMQIQSNRLSAFDEADQNLLGAAANVTALAVQNARLYQAVQNRAERLAVVNHIARAVNRINCFDDLAEEVHREIDLVFKPDAFFIAFYERETNRLYLPFQIDRGIRSAPERRPLGTGLTSVIVTKKKPLLIRDYVREKDNLPIPTLYGSMEYPASFLGVPMKIEERVIGVICVQAYRREAYGDEEQQLLSTISEQVAIAVENIRLHEQAQKEIAQRARAEAALEKEKASLAEQVAERTAELSAVNADLSRGARMKDEFLSSMSHELRTPLNAVLGMSEALQEEAYGPCNEKQLRALHRIEKSGKQLLSLITDILDLSKIGAGKEKLEIDAVAVDSVCDSALRFVHEEAQKKSLEVSSSLDGGAVMIRADARRLKQILANLLGNAVKFTPSGGSIGLDVEGDIEQQVIRFIVWDTGIGIEGKDMERLFQPFVQSDGRLSREYEGTGLGLALAHRLVEMHGGSISVESQVAKGSRLTVTLPWDGGSGTPEEGEPFGAEQREVEGVEKTRKESLAKVLLTDDNEETISTIADYLEVKGYQVVVARNGAEAVDRASEERPDVILMDIQMPGMDGLEATRLIRADADLSATPIIAFTALAMPGDRERCLEAGANEYLSKPVSLKKLIATIEEQLKGAALGRTDDRRQTTDDG